MTKPFRQAVRPREVPTDAHPGHPSLFFNQELSWLDFNRRVFEQARDPELPVLERVRFLGITAGNLDEFVQKRIGGLRRQEAAGVTRTGSDGRLPSEVLALTRSATRRMETGIDRYWEEELKPLLAEAAGVRLVDYGALTPAQERELTLYFRKHLYPILTPLAVDPGHPFPFISNLSLSLAIEMRHPDSSALHFARLKVPVHSERWLPVRGAGTELRFVAIEEVVRHNVGELFPGMEILRVHAFRVTRNADIEREEEVAEDLLAMISEELRERRLAPVVRLEVEKAMPPHLRALLLKELGLGVEDLVELAGELALADCMALGSLPLPEHRPAPWEPVAAERLGLGELEAAGERDIFSVLREGDILVHHPYESFSSTALRLLQEAALDPAVLAIKQTLYRTSDDSQVIGALLRAADQGKQVAVMVEVKARFDEQNNIEWARMLETVGAHVTYGVVGLKTHAKALLVIREEDGHPRTYCHIGTGNYHKENADAYTDLGLLTSDPEIGADLVNLFHYLTGYAPAQSYRRLVVAPGTMRRSFGELIAREAANAREGRPARIVAKMNAIDDPRIIRRLYEASRAGVSIDLIVRGHCCLRPGLPGHSENIRVVSIIGRFLEHDRIFYFENGGEPVFLIGSADWRRRNLDSRVEAIAPIDDGALKAQLARVLELALADNQLAWDLSADGRYERRSSGAGERPVQLHESLMEDARLGRWSRVPGGDAMRARTVRVAPAASAPGEPGGARRPAARPAEEVRPVRASRPARASA